MGKPWEGLVGGELVGLDLSPWFCLPPALLSFPLTLPALFLVQGDRQKSP